MQPSKAAIDLIKQFEGVRLKAYRDAVGKLTIGYGHTEGVKAGQMITLEQAEALLIEDVTEAAQEIGAFVKVPLTQGQFDALVCFVFNLGAANFVRSTLLKLLNAGNPQAAAKQFNVWVMAAGQVLPGLVKRRAAERVLFESNCHENTSWPPTLGHEA